MREDEQVPACAWMNKLQRGRELDVRECSAQAWRGECARWSENQVNPMRGCEQTIVSPA